MSTDLTVGLRRKAEAKRNGDVTIASIWSVLYLLMVVGAAAGVSILSSAPARAVWTEQLAIHHPISLERKESLTAFLTSFGPTPTTPLPSPLVLMGSGLVALILLRRRGRHAHKLH